MTVRVEFCIICGNPAEWVRHTQFAGKHPFCSKHAREEDDFRTKDDSYHVWEKLSKRRIPKLSSTVDWLEDAINHAIASGMIEIKNGTPSSLAKFIKTYEIGKVRRP